MNHLDFITIVVPVLLFIVFLWFFISPCLRDKSVIAPAAARQDIDTEGLHSNEDQYEKASLLTWMRRSSRGRFAGTKDDHKAHDAPLPAPSRSEAHRFSLSTLFARSPLVPHVPSVATMSPVTPPPSHKFPPTVSSPLAGPPLECIVPPEQARMSFVPRIFVPSRRISFRSISGLPMTSMTMRSASDSNSTGSRARLPPQLPVPPRALLLARKFPESNVNMRMEVGEARTHAGLPIGKVARAFGERTQ